MLTSYTAKQADTRCDHLFLLRFPNSVASNWPEFSFISAKRWPKILHLLTVTRIIITSNILAGQHEHWLHICKKIIPTFSISLQSGGLTHIGRSFIHQHIFLRFFITWSTNLKKKDYKFIWWGQPVYTHFTDVLFYTFRIYYLKNLPMMVLFTVPASLSKSSSIKSTNSFSTCKSKEGWCSISQSREQNVWTEWMMINVLA